MIDTIKMKDGVITIIDQTRLPGKMVMKKIRTIQDMAHAIRQLEVRGAPAIGVAAAFALGRLAKTVRARNKDDFIGQFSSAARELNASRPTAVNLFWATGRMEKALKRNAALDLDKIRELLYKEALDIYDEDYEMSRRMGETGNKLIRKGDVILTHCNAGGLATSGLGTALAVMYAAKKSGKDITVYADETRPLLQGARLTTLELTRAGIRTFLISDNMAAFAIHTKKISKIIVGADRIARNGDTANKIGTLNLGILAQYYGIPLYVTAPSSTFDLSMASGASIPVEERPGTELKFFNGRRIAPEEVGTYNPAFDITSGELIAGFITERGLISKPFKKNIPRILKEHSKNGKLAR
jgi:methylthioribose-1-phosphate isomerase